MIVLQLNSGGMIWGRLYQNKMDENSHFSFQDGAKHIINETKVAYLQNGEQLRYFDEFNCKVSFTYILLYKTHYLD